jgi:hypothetical protein
MTRSEAIRIVREGFAFLGYPLDDLTDEELIAGIVGLVKVVANTGISAEEAASALVKLGEVKNGSQT